MLSYLFQLLQVLWEVFPSESAPSVSFVDLLLHGVWTEGITSTTPRADTQTWALEFFGNAVVTVAAQEQPAAETINDGFTIRYSIEIFLSLIHH